MFKGRITERRRERGNLAKKEGRGREKERERDIERGGSHLVAHGSLSKCLQQPRTGSG